MWYALRVIGKKASFFIVALLFAAAGIGFYLYRIAVPEKPAPDIMLIGIDGASWNLMREALDAGKLPHIRRLIDSGVRGNLKTFLPTSSPVLWTTIATSKTQAKHGIGSFTAEHDGEQIPVSGMQRATKAFWNIFSDYKVSVGLVNWWVTWPPEAITGYVVSDHYRNWNPKKFKAAVTYPASLLAELPKVGMTKAQYEEEAARLGLPQLAPSADFPQLQSLARGYKSYWSHDRAIRESSRRLLQSRQVNVFAAVFRIVDVSSHLYWSFLDAERLRKAKSQAEIEELDREFSRRMMPVYAYADAIVGDFLAHANSRTHIVICSDHGFRFDQGRYGHSNMEDPPDGVLILNGPAFREDAEIRGATLLDITATLLYLKGIPVGKDMDGKVLLDAFEPEFRKAHPVKYVDSHDKGWSLDTRTQPSEMDKEIMEDLRSLGYIN